jgi:hypothetical protein
MEERLNQILAYLQLDYKIFKTVELKNECVKKQDFATALTHREAEIKLREQFVSLGQILLNIDLSPEVSGTTKGDSSKEAGKQNN